MNRCDNANKRVKNQNIYNNFDFGRYKSGVMYIVFVLGIVTLYHGNYKLLVTILPATVAIFGFHS